MAGYGGQMIALDTEPFNLATPLANAQSIIGAQQQNQLAAQLNPLRVQQAQQETDLAGQLDPLKVAAAKRTDLTQDLGTQDSLIARAASLVDPNDPDASEKWDEAMQDAAAKGAQGAQQFVGRFSPALRQRVTGAYAAQTPLAAATSMGGGGLPTTQPAPTEQLDLAFKDMPPEKMKQTADGLDKIKQALIRVSQSQNPSATWDQEAQALGHPDWVGKYSPLQLQRTWDSTVPVDDYLQSRLTKEGAGVPAPIVKPDMKEVGGALYNIDQKTGKATLAAGGKWVLAGTDPETKEGIYVNTETSEEKHGSMPLGAKPGTQSTRLSVYQLKQQAYLDAHPGDTQGALDYANGRKNMTPEAIQAFAISQATRDYQAAALGGEVIPDQGSYIGQRAAAIAGQLSAAQGGAAPRPAPSPSPQNPPPSALANLVEGQPTTFRNGQVWTKKNGKPVRVH